MLGDLGVVLNSQEGDRAPCERLPTSVSTGTAKGQPCSLLAWRVFGAGLEQEPHLSPELGNARTATHSPAVVSLPAGML